MAKGKSANNQRSNSLNPNNAAYRAAQGNKSNQMNPKHAAYGASRSARPSGGGGGGWGLAEERETPAPPTLDELIANGRREFEDGITWNPVPGVEARLRERDAAALREFVRAYCAAVPSLGAGWAEAAAAQEQGEIVDIVWSMIRKEFADGLSGPLGRYDFDRYLRDTWAPKHLPEGLPKRPVTPEEEQATRDYYDDDDDFHF